MRVLVTLGGTSERIDQVRSITNHSTGKLGNDVIQQLVERQIQVDAIVTTSAIQPAVHPNITIHSIDNTQALLTTLIDLMTHFTYDAVIHSMAVSDFTPTISESEEQFLTKINTWIQQHPGELMDAAAFKTFLHPTADQKQATKLSSATDHLVLLLEKTPKVIQKIKQLQPTTLLVGFKLLVDVPQAELFSVAKASLLKSDADFVLANDLTAIDDTQHIGYLLNREGLVAQATTKTAIAKMIVEQLILVNNQKE